MITLRAAQARESPDQVEARRMAARESARKYRERNRQFLAKKAKNRRTVLKNRKERAAATERRRVEQERLAELASLPKVVSQARAVVWIDGDTDDEGGEGSDDGSDDAA